MEMEDYQQQQQRPHSIHRSILEGIARLADRDHRAERHKLIVIGHSWISPTTNVLDRHSLQHLVTFFDDIDSHEVTELHFDDVILLQPSDGGLEILRSFFARSDTTLTKVTLWNCNVGSAQEDASQLLMAFQTNTTVTGLIIRNILSNLQGAALGNCFSGLMQNMPQLQRLDCEYSILRVEGIRAFQPALQANRTLRELGLSRGHFGDEGIRIIADSLVGNTTIEVLDISHNGITSNGFDGITRLLESTQIKTIYLNWNHHIFNDNVATQRFAAVLSRHEFLQHLDLCHCEIGDEGIHLIVDGLIGNTIMEVLVINDNKITSVGLANITRLLVSTKLKTIAFEGNRGIFNDEDATQHFVTTLQHKKSSVQELPCRYDPHSTICLGTSISASIKNYLKRNQQLNRVNLLLAPPPPQQQQQQQQRNAGTMMLKISHKAIAKFAKVPNNAGASAIFKLFQARPALLEKRLKRPAAATAAAVADSQDCSTDNSIQASSSAATNSQPTIKRQRRL